MRASSLLWGLPLMSRGVLAKLKTYSWNITWVNASPDGFQRPVVGINGQWPCPSLDVNPGDIVKIKVFNGLGNETTAIHFHGLFQNGTTFMDGPAKVTQCPIAPGMSFVYQFTMNQTGTYWYHAHVGGQYIDGLRGPLIVHDSKAPWGTFDQEYTLTLSDWYHQQAPFLINYFLSPENTMATGGAEPVPNSALMNEAQNVKFAVQPGKTYLFRIINMGAVAGQYLQFAGHNMTIVEADGVYTQPQSVSQLFVGVAQRYSVLVKTKSASDENFAIVASMNTDMFDSTVTPSDQIQNSTGYLVYDSNKILPAPFALTPEPWDDLTLVPYDQQPVLTNPDSYIYITADFGEDGYGITRGMMNGVTYVPQNVPTLYSVLTAPKDQIENPSAYGLNANAFILSHNSVIELNINNHDSRAHPFHLHGHNFQVVSRADGGSLFPGLDAEPAIPMRRDTIIVYGGTSATVRFRADNPGVNLFHCHTEWHVESGLTATFIEAPVQLQAAKPYIPVSHRAVCDKQGIPRKGNAAGNWKDWTNLTGAPTEASEESWGALTNPPTSNSARKMKTRRLI